MKAAKSFLTFAYLILIVFIVVIFNYFVKTTLEDSSIVFTKYFDNLILNKQFLVAKLDSDFFDPVLNRSFKGILNEGPNKYIKGIYYAFDTLKYVERCENGYCLYEIPIYLFNLNIDSIKYYDVIVSDKVVFSSENLKIGSNYEKGFFEESTISEFGFTFVVGYKTKFVLMFNLYIVLIFTIAYFLSYFLFYNEEKKIKRMDNVLKNLNKELIKVYEDFEKNKELKEFNISKTHIESVNVLQENINKLFVEFKRIFGEYERTAQMLESTMAELEETNAELVEKNLQIISALAEAVELKDSVTGNHSRNVMELSLYLAKKFNIKEPAEIEAIKYGAILHDIGKIGIPEHILNKPGKLNDEEFEIMKKHTIYGEKIIKAIPGWSLVADIIRHHHENWDGSGYPDGLKDGEISLRAQIVSIVDVFVALTEDRPYRKGLTIEKTLSIMKEMVGIKFSEKLFEKFLEVLREKGYLS
ncbi:phosphohydrolase [Thermosipho melanesiensis]|uniref:Metal dependent phosphohydrolase n=1 Tax=Thermosipho melanesiensis (strain DSM 12029 / CIP 104789 / BI429) TaxID=391009 RepID=A6LNH0_THEM4|nr:metal dependent phosphohydrolase [Thermosipho melanesiensis BI429]OOC36810.1 phosphohydrolase [Thermosipho melanesiensis]OOC37347.1 phosphohydrolase [Thermosipho melanesiensis]OOC38098.1 phosphohydrolase [Thermosipho melanesiensis]OOC41328.1 phosphohydrolase [Thermosipho melanesiensis]